MIKRTCLACIAFVGCQRRVDMGRAILISGQPEKNVFKLPAKRCRSWREYPGIQARMAQNALLKKIAEAIGRGEVVVLYKDGRPVPEFVGGYPDIELARIAAKGQPCILIKLA